MKNLVIINLVVLLVCGCVSHTEARYPEIYKDIKKAETMDLVVDAVVYSDIKGKDIGIDLEKNKKLREDIEKYLKLELTAKGYQINSFNIGSGLFHSSCCVEKNESQKSEEIKFVVSEKGISTDQQWLGGAMDINGDPFTTEETINYFNSLFEYAKFSGLRKRKTEIGQKLGEHFQHLNKPDVLDNFSTGVLGLVKVQVSEVSTEKKVVEAIVFTAALGIALSMGDLSGGAYVAVPVPAKDVNYRFLLFDLEKEEIIWYREIFQAGGVDSAEKAIENTVKLLPNRSNPTPIIRKKKKPRSPMNMNTR